MGLVTYTCKKSKCTSSNSEDRASRHRVEPPKAEVRCPSEVRQSYLPTQPVSVGQTKAVLRSEEVRDSGAIEDLFFEEVKTKDGPLYLVFEKITPKNKNFWEIYYLEADALSRKCDLLCNQLVSKEGEVNEGKIPINEAFFNFSQEELTEIANKVVIKNECYKVDKETAIGRGDTLLGGGIAGFGMWKMQKDKDPELQCFVTYISSKRPEKNDYDRLKFRKFEQNFCGFYSFSDYKKYFGNIVMCVMFATKENLPQTTHYGIFKNPLYFVDPSLAGKHRGISMQLHGFGAKMALTKMKGKKFMVTNPMGNMHLILEKKLGKENI